MSAENLASIVVVFVSKNLDLDAKLEELLAPTYGRVMWHNGKRWKARWSVGVNVLHSDAFELYDEEGINWDALAALLKNGVEPLV